jgi:predicted Zn-dependent protease
VPAPLPNHSQRYREIFYTFLYRKKISLAIIIILFSLSLSGCATIYNPATEREELILIDTASEVALGNNLAVQIERQYVLSKDVDLNKHVEEIGQRIASYSDRTDLQYHFKVVKNKEVNAFSTPGGYVYVHTGLLKIVNDDELACVIGHEVGHIAAKHSVKKLQAQMGYNILMSLAFSRGRFHDLQRVINITFNLITQGYSREDEFLADKLGVKYTYKAGYEPQGMITFLNKLKEIEGRKPSAIEIILRSHPAISQRIKNTQDEIALLKGEKTEITPPQTEPETKSQTLPQAKPETITTLPQVDKISSDKYCPTCGRAYRTRYNFCPKDGSRLISH